MALPKSAVTEITETMTIHTPLFCEWKGVPYI